MTIDIPTLITKLRSAPQKVGTFDRGDPKPLDEYRVVLTGEERDWLIVAARSMMSMQQQASMLHGSANTKVATSGALEEGEK